MAAGLPVVASRSGAVPETVVDGSTGLVVEKNDAPALARALAILIDNDQLRRTMGRAGRNRALQQFTWDRIAETMHARYRSLCRKPESVHADSSIGRTCGL